MKLSGVTRYGPRNNSLNFGVDLNPGELSCLGGPLLILVYEIKVPAINLNILVLSPAGELCYISVPICLFVISSV